MTSTLQYKKKMKGFFGGKQPQDNIKDHPKRRLRKDKEDTDRPKDDEKDDEKDVRRDSLGVTVKPDQRTRKNKMWMKTDPLEFPPSNYHRSLFQCNQPFITLSDTLPGYDSFAKLEMKAEVRIKAIDFMLKPCYDIFRSMVASNSDVGELGARVLHLSLLQRLWRLTKPSKRLLKSLDTLENDYELQYGARKRAKVEIAQDDENQDFVAQEIVPEQEGPSSLGAVESTSSNESLLFACEKRPDNGEETGRGRMDVRLSVISNCNLKLKDKFGIKHMVDSERCAGIVECKYEAEDKNAVYQGAGYACQEAVRNINNLFFDPIYVLVETKSKWTHGILDVRGKIGVIKGEIDWSTFPDFEQQEQVRHSNQRTSFLDLEAMLRESTHFYREHFSDHPDAVYPSGKYLVGTLHICDEWHVLPDFTCVNAAMRHGVHLFYEGLLKMIIGNKVTKWEMEDFERAKKLKKDLRDEHRYLLFASVEL